MVPVANRPLIDHALEVVEDAGAYPIAVNAHHFAALLAKHLSDCDVSISYEAPAPLETGGGLKRAVQDGFLPADQPVFTLNTDAVWRGENPLTQLAAAWRPEMDALVLLMGDSDVKDFSLDDSGRIRRGAGYRYTGAQIIRPSFVMSHHETVFSLNAVWDGLISQGTAFGLVHQGD
jgi:MurNAc alpha-1-phosphate uridylyltransferase